MRAPPATTATPAPAAVGETLESPEIASESATLPESAKAKGGDRGGAAAECILVVIALIIPGRVVARDVTDAGELGMLALNNSVKCSRSLRCCSCALDNSDTSTHCVHPILNILCLACPSVLANRVRLRLHTSVCFFHIRMLLTNNLERRCPWSLNVTWSTDPTCTVCALHVSNARDR
jgi:hypothetical protein